METTENQTAGWGQRLIESVSVKLLVIGFLAILLLIPMYQVTSLIRERQQRQRSVVAEIGRSWSGPQTLGGPVLAVPYRKMVKIVVGEVEKQVEETHYLYLLPDKVAIAASTDAHLRRRGIFSAAVYEATVDVTGQFGPLDLAKADVQPEQVVWEKARLAVGVGDLKGLKTNPTITLGDESYEPETEYANIGVFDHNLVVAPTLSGGAWEALPFRFTLDIRGSGDLRFMQLAKRTAVSVEGNWPSPKFSGEFLPDDRQVADSGFTATWQVPHFSRALPQQWTAPQTLIREAEVVNDPSEGYDRYDMGRFEPAVQSYGNGQEAVSFGIHFLQPVDHYQKAERTAKYAVLVIVLTFVSLFFTEIIVKRRVHIIQYVLIGAAMIVYYTLLLSFSEHLGFNAAYAVASLATIGLVGLFIGKLLGQRRMALIFSGTLGVFYGFIFVIIQLQDMALLVGSIGLFATVALLMYFSSRINWRG